MPRNIQPNKKNIKSSQLLTFCDASEEAVAAAVYLNTSYEDGSSNFRLVMSKTKLAPCKTISIPKLELNAALQSNRNLMLIRLTAFNLIRCFISLIVCLFCSTLHSGT